MSHLSSLCEPPTSSFVQQKDLHVLAALVPDELFNVIRTIVPPPPPIENLADDVDRPKNSLKPHCPTKEKFFTRRPTEESLLETLNRQVNRAEEAKCLLEELYIHLVEPKKYSNVLAITHCLLDHMRKWPKELRVQEQALACLERLCEQSNDFSLSQTDLYLILDVTKNFETSEMIQRMGIKLLMNKKNFDRLVKKVHLACAILNALCNIPGVDDFMVYAKNIVCELDTTEKLCLRAHQPFVEMLLDFPKRDNEKITVYLCWCALDTLISLADIDTPWNILIQINGRVKLQELSCRPELEDRCKTLLRKALPLAKDTVNPLNVEHDVSGLYAKGFSTEIPFPSHSLPPLNQKEQSLFESSQNHWEPQDGHNILEQLEEQSTEELLPSRTPTRNRKEDYEEQFSSDESVQILTSPYSPYGSPSYSPPSETSAVLSKTIEYLNEKLASEEEINYDGNSSSITNPTSNNVKICTSSVEMGHKKKPLPSIESVSCIICKEPKGKQPLLVKQLKQIGHCLHQPCNILLFNCIESNICKDHRP